MIQKINALKLKIKTTPKNISKKLKNANYKRRYNNLLIKYNELEEKYNSMSVDLERKNNLVKNLRKEVKKYNDFWGGKDE